MRRRPLSRTGLDVGELGLGGAGFLMGLNRAVDQAEAVAILHRARELGVNYFDTAPLYGAGLSEERLGLGLAGDAGAIIATKVGAFLGDGVEYDFSGPAVKRSVQRSQELLQRDRINIVQVHELTTEAWPTVFGPDGAVDALRELQDEGSVDHLGVTGSDPDVLIRAVRTGLFAVVQVWRAWNLLDQRAEPLLSAAADAGVAVVVGTPFAAGLLAAPTGSYYYSDAPPEMREAARVMSEAASRFDVPLPAAALRFCLDDRVSVALTGVDSAEQLEANVAYVETDLSPEAIAQIAAAGR